MPPKKRFVTCEICGDRAKRLDREKRKFMAKFPLDESRCRQWVKFVGKEDLIYVPIEKLHSLKYVCGAHFESKAFNKKNNRLNKSAVPLINLGADPLPDEKLLEFPCHISSYTDMITMEVSKRTNLNVASTAMTEPIAGPSHMEKSTSSDLLLLEHAYCIQKEIILPETTRCKKVKTSHSGKAKPSIGASKVTIDFSSEPAVCDYTDENEEDKPPESPVEVLVESEKHHVPTEVPYSWQMASESVDVPQDVLRVPDSGPQTLSMDCDMNLELQPAKIVDDEPQNDGFKCDICKENINGFRYTCVECSQMDLCSGCESRGEHDQHYVLKIPELRPYNEVQELLAKIRSYLLKKSDPIAEKDDYDAASVKSEIKSENEGDFEAVEIQAETADSVEDMDSSSESSNSEGEDQTTEHVSMEIENQDSTMNLKSKASPQRLDGSSPKKRDSANLDIAQNYSKIRVLTVGPELDENMRRLIVKVPRIDNSIDTLQSGHRNIVSREDDDVICTDRTVQHSRSAKSEGVNRVAATKRNPIILKKSQLKMLKLPPDLLPKPAQIATQIRFVKELKNLSTIIDS